MKLKSEEEYAEKYEELRPIAFQTWDVDDVETIDEEEKKVNNLNLKLSIICLDDIKDNDKSVNIAF